ncbi:MAG: deoxynucleoside kinase [Tenuifilaceae bacterium]|jgi:deoxyadenosine/deoxycytidine kinase|nr:deoxynucleoside kinase [Bacteroidales bacterium]MDI9515981.1 deoxynucleoside kinase [Bacteroidota bacterium]NLH57481.1 deoxynucleoside kinase [Rikenellaceae bacterium]OQC64201.1 MAG: Deoxyadenosine/deoxycytidine kinase [Bacteroidetes bacterium ADurb.Bin008]HNV80789.1 deoxynucleoside kinase [Tenuifilaceae bacterium]
MHIAVAGNIGSGKTTLTRLLSKHYGWKPHFEDVDDNPYLNDFYEDMQRWSFNLQIYFLNSRFNQIVEIRRTGDKVIQDRTIYEDAHIFAPNLHSMGLMSTRDFNNYLSLFNLMCSLIQPPDLLIYLRATVPTLVNQIQKRGREYEKSIRLDYLQRLNERYEAWIENYKLGKLLIIEVDNLNFPEVPADLRSIITRIDALIHGLF